MLHIAQCGDDPVVAIQGARRFNDVHQLLGKGKIIGAVADLGVAIMAPVVCTIQNWRRWRPNPVQWKASPSAPPSLAESTSLSCAKSMSGVSSANSCAQGAEKPSFDACTEAVHHHRDQL